MDRFNRELTVGDIVNVVGLTGTEGKRLNGKIGIIAQSKEHSKKKLKNKQADSMIHPECKAVREDGKYSVIITLDPSEEFEPSRVEKEQTRLNIKRENLRLISGKLELQERTFTTTPEKEEFFPGIKGFHTAVRQGDPVKVREIMEYIKHHFLAKSLESDVADWIKDGSGNTALFTAIKNGHVEVFKTLIEYGADVNAPHGIYNPASRWNNLYILHFAISTLDTSKPEKVQAVEIIINMLLESGADAHKVSRGAGNLLNILIGQVSKVEAHGARLRVMRKVLERGLDPNDFTKLIRSPRTSRQERPPLVQRCPLSDAISMQYEGPLEHRIQLIELLLEFGADPAKYFERNKKRSNSILMASHYRMTSILELLLKTEKGRAAVNSKITMPNSPRDGEHALLMTVNLDAFERKEGSSLRECAVILLKYGANMNQARANGLRAFDLLGGDKPKVAEKREQLMSVFKKAPKRTKKRATLEYWDIEKNEQVKEFVGKSSGHQCPICLVWSDRMKIFHGRTSPGFMKCSQCLKQMYCSQECQKRHWHYHKTVCKKV